MSSSSKSKALPVVSEALCQVSLSEPAQQNLEIDELAQQKNFPQRRARVEDLPIPAVGYRRTCAARMAIPVDPQAPTQRVLLWV